MQLLAFLESKSETDIGDADALLVLHTQAHLIELIYQTRCFVGQSDGQLRGARTNPTQDKRYRFNPE